MKKVVVSDLTTLLLVLMLLCFSTFMFLCFLFVVLYLETLDHYYVPFLVDVMFLEVFTIRSFITSHLDLIPHWLHQLYNQEKRIRKKRKQNCLHRRHIQPRIYCKYTRVLLYSVQDFVNTFHGVCEGVSVSVSLCLCLSVCECE